MDFNKGQNINAKKKIGVRGAPKQRISTKEFLNDVQNLAIQDQFFIHFRDDRGLWHKLFDAKLEMPYLPKIRCNVCSTQIKLQDFVEHLSATTHLMDLKRVQQIFHPAYTYAKKSTKLANGEKVSQAELEEALALADKELCILYNSKTLCAVRSFVTDMIRSTHLVAQAWLPLDDFIALEFCMRPDSWEPLISTEYLQPNGIFTCNLCTVTCHGIITVNAHFNGLAHGRMQLQCHEIRSKKHKQLNKHCLLRYAERFSFRINNKAAWYELKFVKTVEPSPNVENEEAITAEMKCPLEDEGFIGVEYVVKIINEANDVKLYECCLCEAHNESPEDMQMHLITFSHRLKYCEKHFGLTLVEFKKLIGTTKYSNYVRIMRYILHRLALAIERHHSRALPLEVNEERFDNMRAEIMMEVYDLPHATQDNGPDFVDLFNSEAVDNLQSTRIVYVKTAKSLADWWGRFLALPEKNYLNENVVVRVVTQTLGHSTPERSEELHNEDDPNIEGNSASSQTNPTMFHNRRSVSPDLPNIATTINTTVEEVEQMYANYRKNPESHPLYDTEWNLFWKRRKEELIAQGINHSSYNFQPEWVKYFKNRMEELYRECSNKSKSLAIESPPPPPPILETGTKRKFNPEQKYLSSYDLNKKPRHQGNYPWQQQSKQISSATKIKTQPHTLSGINNRSNTIHVLRLLTAVEDHLGSLGSKILDLLTKALSLEKFTKQPEELDEQFLTPDTCTLLETANEKLKGILFAGFLEHSKIQAFNRVIDHTTALLKLADAKGWTAFDNHYNKVDVSRNTSLGNIINKLQKDGVTPSHMVDNLKLQKSRLPHPLPQLYTSDISNQGSSKSYRNLNFTNSSNQNQPHSSAFKPNKYIHSWHSDSSTITDSNSSHLSHPHSSAFKPNKYIHSWRSDSSTIANSNRNMGPFHKRGQGQEPMGEDRFTAQTQNIHNTNFGNMRSYNSNSPGNRYRSTYWRQNEQF